MYTYIAIWYLQCELQNEYNRLSNVFSEYENFMGNLFLIVSTLKLN